MIRILQIVPNMQAGGLETWLMNQYRCLDRTKIQYDFLVHYNKRFFYDDEIEAMGGKIYRCSVREDNNLLKYFSFLYHFFNSHPEYKIIHGHMPSFSVFYMGIARLCGVPVRINHSHNSSYNNTTKGRIEHFLTKFVKWNANHLFACSDLAGKYMYGKSHYTLIHNAVDVDRFKFNPMVRDEVRKEFDVTDKFVLGHIGRFTLQKNHTFLLDIFKDLLVKKSNSVLLLIGTGELEEEIKAKADSLGLTNHIIFTGVRKDAERLYQAMDVFVLPSLYEGLPVVGIEAQASGAPFFVSDTVTKEVKLLPTTVFLPINQGTSCWVNALVNLIPLNRDDAYRMVARQGYGIKEETARIVKIYTDFYNSVK